MIEFNLCFWRVMKLKNLYLTLFLNSHTYFICKVLEWEYNPFEWFRNLYFFSYYYYVRLQISEALWSIPFLDGVFACSLPSSHGHFLPLLQTDGEFFANLDGAVNPNCKSQSVWKRYIASIYWSIVRDTYNLLSEACVITS